jgi:hypothetical protein
MNTRLFTTIGVCLLVLTVAGCANRVNLVNTPLVPAADGRLTISTDRNDNTKVKLEVKHLAPPSALTPPQETYVVWTRSEDGSPQKQAVLQVGDNRQGEIEFITPAANFEVVVTAESSPDVQFPSNMVAFTSEVGR